MFAKALKHAMIGYNFLLAIVRIDTPTEGGLTLPSLLSKIESYEMPCLPM
jgi:hypothetical protein